MQAARVKELMPNRMWWGPALLAGCFIASVPICGCDDTASKRSQIEAMVLSCQDVARQRSAAQALATYRGIQNRYGQDMSLAAPDVLRGTLLELIEVHLLEDRLSVAATLAFECLKVDSPGDPALGDLAAMAVYLTAVAGQHDEILAMRQWRSGPQWQRLFDVADQLIRVRKDTRESDTQPAVEIASRPMADPELRAWYSLITSHIYMMTGRPRSAWSSVRRDVFLLPASGFEVTSDREKVAGYEERGRFLADLAPVRALLIHITEHSGNVAEAAREPTNALRLYDMALEIKLYYDYHARHVMEKRVLERRANIEW